jgi:hypothetical protein
MGNAEILAEIEDVPSSLFMIQPTLMQFNLGQPSQPLLLNTTPLHRNSVLLLDPFLVWCWYGADIVARCDPSEEN